MTYVYMERPWSRKIILKICKQRGITPLELAKSGKFLGKNIRSRPLKLYELKCLIKILPSCAKGKMDAYVFWGRKKVIDKDTKTEFSASEILNKYLVRFPPCDSEIIQRELNDIQQLAFNQNLSSEFTLLNPHHVRVGTIHSAKGLEADVVFVFNNHCHKTEQFLLDYREHARENETRLYYVGITRARKTCYLIDDFFNRYTFEMEGLNGP